MDTDSRYSKVRERSLQATATYSKPFQLLYSHRHRLTWSCPPTHRRQWRTLRIVYYSSKIISRYQSKEVVTTLVQILRKSKTNGNRRLKELRRMKTRQSLPRKIVLIIGRVLALWRSRHKIIGKLGSNRSICSVGDQLLLFILFFTNHWSRQCFIQQKNRHSVHSLIDWEEHPVILEAGHFTPFIKKLPPSCLEYALMIGQWVSTSAFIGKTISAISGLLMRIQHLVTYTLSKLFSIDEPFEVVARYAGRVYDKNCAVIIKDAWLSKDRSPDGSCSKK